MRFDQVKELEDEKFNPYWVKWVENTLIKHPNFALPGRKALMKDDMDYEVVLVYATESPIERPKKTKVILFRKKEKAYFKNPNSDRQENNTSNMYRFCQW